MDEVGRWRPAAPPAVGPGHGAPSPTQDAGTRILWKGALFLHDGTHLPGVSIVTTMQPWTHLRTHSSQATEDTELEAEAELCFALEMVRHHPLRARPRYEAPRVGRAPPEAPAVCRASGAIQLQLDGAEDATQAFFLRLFGVESALRPGEDTQQALHLTFDPSTRPTGPTYRSGAVFELWLVGRCAHDGMLDLVIGRKVDGTTKERRPDDPLPRVAAAGRERVEDAWASSDDDAPLTRIDVRMRRRGQLPTSPRQSRGHTPGRRGEKRAQRVPLELPRPRERTRSPAASVWRPVVAPIAVPGRGPPDALVEQQNRSRIKKLVHAQLVGRGMDRSHDDHSPCFQMAYAGTCLVFRHALDSVPLEASALAPVITAHLDMYMHPAQLALCTRGS